MQVEWYQSKGSGDSRSTIQVWRWGEVSCASVATRFLWSLRCGCRDNELDFIEFLGKTGNWNWPGFTGMMISEDEFVIREIKSHILGLPPVSFIVIWQDFEKHSVCLTRKTTGQDSVNIAWYFMQIHIVSWLPAHMAWVWIWGCRQCDRSHASSRWFWWIWYGWEKDHDSCRGIGLLWVCAYDHRSRICCDTHNTQSTCWD